MRTPSLLLATLCLLGLALPAEAQIYAWRDARGTLVLSDEPQKGTEAPATFEVPGAALRATRAAGPGGHHEFDAIITRHARTHRVSPDLVRAVIQVESGFDPNAVSPRGAAGLMQIMPDTARDLGLADPFHPEDNIRAGVTYLRQLLDRYEDDVELALAAYNAGPGTVARYGDAVPPYRETRNYVKKVTGAAGAAPLAPSPTAIYKWIEVVDGRPVPRYSNQPPAGVAYEVVRRW
ncbi:MAG: lytic transglycosylase domain-containing protein [Vicinamibacterales bacterium]